VADRVVPGLPVAELVGRDAADPGHGMAVRRMFDRISPTYDLLNRLMSLGIDRRWRARALDALAQDLPSGPLLDSCAGTLDLTRAMAGRFADRPLWAGDFARAMLVAGRTKLGDRAQLAVCDAQRLPFARASFAGLVCGFGMRNLTDPVCGLREAHRVLAEGGVCVVLEFYRPTRLVTRLFHAFYGRLLLPTVGWLVSGDGSAYRYLSRSMVGFLTRSEFEQAMIDVGFREVQGQDLTLGIASIIRGVK